MVNIIAPYGDCFGFSMKTMHHYRRVVLYPQEIKLLNRKITDERKMEFYLGRAAAHSALKKINIDDFPVLKGDNNEPLWPSGVVGAISHCNGIALAIVAPKKKLRGSA